MHAHDTDTEAPLHKIKQTDPLAELNISPRGPKECTFEDLIILQKEINQITNDELSHNEEISKTN